MLYEVITEIKDILRDRRTIMAMVLVPVLFYPVVSIGLGTLISSQMERTWAQRQEILVLPLDRITSYNVCYTKLLRYRHGRDPTSGERVETMGKKKKKRNNFV